MKEEILLTNKKLFIALFGALMLLAVGCTSTQQTNTETTPSNTENNNTTVNEEVNNDEQLENEASEIDTSDWETYTNEEYGFSFQYPNNWKINSDDIQTITLFSPERAAELEKESIVYPDLVLNIYKPASEAPYIIQNEFSKSLKTAEQENYIKDLTFSSPTRAQFIEYNEFGNTDEVINYIILNDDTLIKSTYTYKSDTITTFETILNTLQFN